VRERPQKTNLQKDSAQRCIEEVNPLVRQIGGSGSLTLLRPQVWPAIPKQHNTHTQPYPPFGGTYSTFSSRLAHNRLSFASLISVAERDENSASVFVVSAIESTVTKKEMILECFCRL
jgi:hypothetical protein